MPELPEVETIRVGLENALVGQKFVDITVLLPKMFIGSTEAVTGSKIIGVSRRGKLLIVTTDGAYSLLIHLKMTGQLLLASLLGKHGLPDKSTKVIFTLASGDRLFFNDVRTFGYIRVHETKLLAQFPFLQKIGIEPFDPQFTAEYLVKLIHKSSRLSIKTFLLDQTKIAGLGNIYTDEALFLAKILPTRSAGSLSSLEIERLHSSIIEVMEKGVRLGGSSRTNYITLAGTKGDFLSEAHVYQREDLPCTVCGNLIHKVQFAGRGTHFCPYCQK